MRITRVFTGSPDSKLRAQTACAGNRGFPYPPSASIEIEGDIKNITEFGLFIGLPGEIDGMVHFSDLDWNLPGEEAVKSYQKGDTVKVKVLDVDVSKERISLGIKQLSDDPFTGTTQKVKKGEVVTCTVQQVLDNGIEVQLTGGATGFIRKAELSRDRSEQQPSRFAVGEKLDARVTAVDPRARKIALSIKQREIAEEKKAVADYGSSESGASLGDILGAAFSKAAEAKKATDDKAIDETAPAAPEQEEAPEAAESEEAAAELAVEAEDATEKKSSKKAAAAEEAAEEQATEEQAAEDVADDAAEEAAEDAPEAAEEAPAQDTAEAESDDSKKD